jgi:hypothetical protein
MKCIDGGECGIGGYCDECTASNDAKRTIDRLVMRVTIHGGMVKIDSEKMMYANIRNMYVNGNGSGLQLIEDIEHKRGEIVDLCAQIADSLYQLEDIFSA